MALKRFKPTSPGLRHAEWPDYSDLTKVAPEKSLLRPLPKKGGRNHQGRITSRFRGGGHKRMYRVIDFTRDKEDSGAGRHARVRPEPVGVDHPPSLRRRREALHHRSNGT